MENFYSIKETVANYAAGCNNKIQAAPKALFGKAILAGLMIGMGAAGSSVAAHTISDVGLARLAAAVVFPVGLMMVILLGAELFTGNCLMVIGTAAKKQKISDLIRVLMTVFAGNFIGAAALALLVSASGQLDYSGGILGAYTIKVALAKVNLPFGQAMISGVLCNILVCAAVLMAGCAKDITGKLLASFFTIMLFVTAGFEHCVANMYYITAGMAALKNPAYVQLAVQEYGFSADQLATLNIGNFMVANLLPVTIGNVVGGAVLGLALLYFNKEKAVETVKEEKRNGIVFDNHVAGALH
ncbi:MAG: formate/nitrite transporter family protein [Clostridia bacterium]|nr:formate/nitrite transporter family protein [Clostridia bacterium]